MSDDSAPVPAQPHAPEPGAGPLEPPPAAPAGPDYAAELERLRGDHARTREELAAANATVRLLAPKDQPVDQNMPLVRLTQADARRVAQSLGGGWTEEAV